MALITVVVVIGLLILLVFDLSRRFRARVGNEALARERIQRELCLRSGLAIAESALSRKHDAPGVDHLGETWAQPIAVETEWGLLAVRIQDEAGKLDIGGALRGGPEEAREARRRQQRYRLRTRTESPELEAALDRALAASASRSTPWRTLDQLREIGIDRALIFERTDHRPTCLADRLTIWSPPRVNLNTAHEALLHAIADEMNGDVVRALLGQRLQGRALRTIEDLRAFGIIKEPRVVRRFEPSPEERLLAHLEQFCGFAAAVFRVEIRLRVEGKERDLLAHAYLRRPVDAEEPLEWLSYEVIR